VIGASIGSYVIRAKAGEGGMGTVYAAEHAVLGRRVAIKVLQPEMSSDRSVVARFFNEARMASSIRHPSIVEVHDFGYLPEGSAYIVMEYLEGESLAARRRRLGRLDPLRSLTYARQIAGGLAAAHELGIVHRDLKPDNVFVVCDPEVASGERVKLLDFGVAKLERACDMSLTQAGSVIGTPAYMAPEQCRGTEQVDARADLYALGCVLFELVCGRPPFVIDGAAELMAHHLYFDPPSPRELAPGLPAPIEALVMRLLHKQPAQRVQTARELIEEIDRVISIASDEAERVTVIAAAVEPTTPASTTLSSATGVASARTRAGGSWLAAAAVIASGAAGFGLYLASHAAPDRAPTAAAAPIAVVMTPAPRVTAPPPTPAEPERVQLRLTSRPSGATVKLGDRVVGTTPYRADVARGHDVRAFVIEHAGYEPATVSVPTDRNDEVFVDLHARPSPQRAAKPAPARPVPAAPPPPAPDPSTTPTPELGDQSVNPFAP